MINDYYNYINDDWIKKKVIKNNKCYISEFDILYNKNMNTIKNIINDNSQLKTFYNSIINNNSKYEILLEYIKLIDKVNNLDDYMLCLSELYIIDCNIFWNMYVDNDLLNYNEKKIYIECSDINLSNIYTNDKIINEYKKYMFSMIKINEETYNTIINFEKKLLNIQTKSTNINKKNIYDILPDINFKKYIYNIINIIGNNNIKNKFNEIYVVSDIKNDYFIKLNYLLKNTDIYTIKSYTKWYLLNKYLPLLNDKYYEKYYNFYKIKLKGKNKIKSNEKKAIEYCKYYLNDIINNEFYIKFNNSQINNYIKCITENIIETIKSNINKCTWMSNNMKINSINKLNNINIVIENNNYREIDYKLSNDLLKNIINIEKINVNKMFDLSMNQDNILNSYDTYIYYNLYNNQLVIPYGILQKDILLYDIDKNNNYVFNDIYNYSRIGTLICQEIFKSIDNYGRYFDIKGYNKNLWDYNDELKYNIIITKIIKMYEIQNINCPLMLSDTLSNIIGLQISLQTLQRLKNNLSHEDYKEFFKQYTELRRTKYSREFFEIIKNSENKEQQQIRVNVALKNINEFYNTYKIKNEIPLEYRLYYFI